MPRQSLGVLVAIVAGLAIAFTIKLYFGVGAPPASRLGGGGPAMLAGAPAESYPIKTLGGGVDSIERYRGHVVFVNLWASWCAPCRSETPSLEQLFREDGRRGLIVLGIDQGESVAAAGAFAKEMHLSYPILLDEDQQYGRAYAAVGLPTSLIVDRNGHIVRGIDGEMTLAQMREAVSPLLSAR
jgi:thiol-disulfide isomerase/thioredoxin